MNEKNDQDQPEREDEYDDELPTLAPSRWPLAYFVLFALLIARNILLRTIEGFSPLFPMILLTLCVAVAWGLWKRKEWGRRLGRAVSLFFIVWEAGLGLANLQYNLTSASLTLALAGVSVFILIALRPETYQPETEMGD